MTSRSVLPALVAGALLLLAGCAKDEPARPAGPTEGASVCAVAAAEAARIAADPAAVGTEQVPALRATLDAAAGDPACASMRQTLLAALGMLAERERDSGAARSQWETVLRSEPGRLDAKIALGALLAADPQTATEARPYLMEAIAEAPDNPVVLRALGRVEIAAGDLPAAIVWLRRGEPDAETARVLADALTRAGDRVGARAVLEEARGRFPDDGSLIQALAGGEPSPPRPPPTEPPPPTTTEPPPFDAAVLGPEGAALFAAMHAAEGQTELLANQLHLLSARLLERDDAALDPWLADTVVASKGGVRGANETLRPGVTVTRWSFPSSPAPLDRARVRGLIGAALDAVPVLEDLRLKVAESDLEPNGALHGKLKALVVGRDAAGHRVQVKARASFRARAQGERWVLEELAALDVERMTAAQDMFVEVGREAGLGSTPTFASTRHHDNNVAYGAAAGDLDGDGLIDALVLGRDRVWVYLNRGDGGFREASAEVGLGELANGRLLTSPLLFDMDDDGDLDLFVGTYGTPVLMRSALAQSGTLRFEDATAGAGLDGAAYAHAVTAADVNGDGHADIYVGSYADDRLGQRVAPTRLYSGANGTPNRLYLSHGDGTFEEAAERLGVADSGWANGAVFGDLDGDGDPDLYVANDFGGGSTAYRNDGGQFTNAGAQWGLFEPGFGMGVDIADYDNDGDLDVQVTNMSSTAGARILARLSPSDLEAYPQHVRNASGDSLYRNDGATFTDVTSTAGPLKASWAWGGRFSDLDNDGWLDLFVPNGFQSGMLFDDT